jgi:hypothetical protein
MNIQIDWQALPISLSGWSDTGCSDSYSAIRYWAYAGVSGIYFRLLKQKRVEMWQVLFIVGSPILYEGLEPLPDMR